MCLARRAVNVRLASLAVLVSIVAGCGGSGPSVPTPMQPTAVTSPAGNWSGTMKDPVFGDGTLQMSLAEQSGMLVGAWSATYKSGGKASGRSVATLVQGGYGITLYADPTPTCAAGQSALLVYTFINVVVTSQRLTATLTPLSCSGPVFVFGSVDLSKQ